MNGIIICVRLILLITKLDGNILASKKKCFASLAVWECDIFLIIFV